MKDLGIDRLMSGPPDGIERTTIFIYEDKDFICPSDELLPKLRELMQIRVLEMKATKGNDFGWAIIQLKDGHKVYRQGWNGKGIFLELQVPDEHSKMTLPYIFINTMGLQNDNAKALVPWLASQSDMLSEDWNRKI